MLFYRNKFLVMNQSQIAALDRTIVIYDKIIFCWLFIAWRMTTCCLPRWYSFLFAFVRLVGTVPTLLIVTRTYIILCTPVVSLIRSHLYVQFCKLVGIKCFHYLLHTIFVPIHLFGKHCLYLTKKCASHNLKIIFHGVD
jgi:hypothetical protein